MENKDFIDKNFQKYMKMAFSEAKKAFEKEEVPIGAVIVSKNGEILAKTHNLTETKKNPLCHAEILAIQKACRKLGEKYLMDSSIFVTLEPCPMCATAISLAKIKNVYFSTMDEKGGAVVNGIKLYENAKNLYKPSVSYGYLSNESTELLKTFFKKLRKK